MVAGGGRNGPDLFKEALDAPIGESDVISGSLAPVAQPERTRLHHLAASREVFDRLCGQPLDAVNLGDKSAVTRQ